MSDLPAIVEEKKTEIAQTIMDEVIVASDRDDLVIKIRKDYEGIIQGLIDSATGMWVEEVVNAKDYRGNPTGMVVKRVYQQRPNTDVAQYLLNQLVGKPKETQVMEGRVTLVRDF